MRKSVALLFTLILALSALIIVIPAFAQTPTPSPIPIPKPSVPEFTVKYVPASYSVTTINPYTGQNVTQQYDNNTIELSITNQQYTYSNGSSFYVYLNVRTKGHFEENWTELYPTVGLLPNSEAYQHPNYKDYYSEYVAFTAEDSRNNYPGLPQSDSTYTVISLPAAASNGQVDFQVEAMIGHNSTSYDPTNDIIYDPANGGVNRPAVAYVTSSGWSNTQTLTISDNSTTASSGTSPTPSSPTPTATPEQPDTQSGVLFGLAWEQIAIILLGIAVVVLVFALVFSRKRSTKQSVSSKMTP